MDFGTAKPNLGTMDVDVMIENHDSVGAQVQTVVLSGNEAGDFRIVSDQCSTTTVAPLGTCALKLQFKPTALGFRQTSLLVTSAGGTTSTTLFATGSF